MKINSKLILFVLIIPSLSFLEMVYISAICIQDFDDSLVLYVTSLIAFYSALHPTQNLVIRCVEFSINY